MDIWQPQETETEHIARNISMILRRINEKGDMPEGIYYHTIEFAATGVDRRTEIAFFLDGKSICKVYSRPADQEPYYCALGT